MIITLRCCTCGGTKQVEVDREPAFGFELMQIASDAGWCPAIDLYYGRTLVFCTKECEAPQITKQGHFRKYLVHKSKEETV